MLRTLIPLVAVLCLAPAAFAAPESDDRRVGNLAAFTRLAGYIQHFHPSDQSYDADWARVVRNGAVAVVDAPGPAELAAALDAVFRPLAPSLQVFAADAPPEPPEPLLASASMPLIGVAHWKHDGFALNFQDRVFGRTRVLVSLRDGRRLSEAPDPTVFHEFDLGAGVACRVTLAVWVSDDNKTRPLPGSTPSAGATGELPPEALDAFVPVALVWNAVQHFSPAFDLAPATMDVEWIDALHDAIAEALRTPAGGDTLAPASAMLGKLRDAQAIARRAEDAALPPFRVDWIGDELVVIGASRDATVSPGDRILTIDGVPASEFVERARAYEVGARDDTRRMLGLERALMGPEGSEIVCTVRKPSDGSERRAAMQRTQPAASPAPPVVASEGVHYIRPEGYDEMSFARILRGDLADARVIIVDYRGQSTAGLHKHLGLFLPINVPPIRIDVPTPSAPDHVNFTYRDRAALIAPKKPRHPARLIFLADGATRGDAELDLCFVKILGLGLIVGDTTAGAPGPAARYPIYDGARAIIAEFTGAGTTTDIEDLPLYGRGVEPDLRVEHSADSLRAGNDAMLAAAIAEALKERPAE